MTIQWDKGRIVGMGWNAEEELCVMSEDGSVHVYTINGDFVSTFNMGSVLLSCARCLAHNN